MIRFAFCNRALGANAKSFFPRRVSSRIGIASDVLSRWDWATKMVASCMSTSASNTIPQGRSLTSQNLKASSTPRIPAFATASCKDIVRFVNESIVAKSVTLSYHYDEIAVAIARLPEFADPSAIASVLFSMRQSTTKGKGVAAVLRALVPRILGAKKLFSGLELSKCFSGLRNMGSDSECVRAVLEALAVRVATCSDTLQSRTIGTILYSMHKMNSDSAEVLKILRIMADKIEELEEPLDGQCIGNSLYGLRYMSSKVFIYT